MDQSTFAAITTIGASAIGGLIGGGLSIVAAMRALKQQSTDLERSEVRRQKVDCIVGITGYRYVLGPVAQSQGSKERFMTEMNKVPALWADDPTVMNCNRDFFANRTNEGLVKLIRAMGRSTTLRIQDLSDSDLLGVFQIL